LAGSELKEGAIMNAFQSRNSVVPLQKKKGDFDPGTREFGPQPTKARTDAAKKLEEGKVLSSREGKE